jgi:hypothetical protein
LLVVALETAATAPFSDVADDEWFAEAVAWLADEGITTGITEGCFDPDGVLSRGEAAVFLHRLAGEPAPAGPLPFIDVTADWQFDAVAWLAEEGITTGGAGPRLPRCHGRLAAGRGVVALRRGHHHGNRSAGIQPGRSGDPRPTRDVSPPVPRDSTCSGADGTDTVPGSPANPRGRRPPSSGEGWTPLTRREILTRLLDSESAMTSREPTNVRWA